MIKGVTSQISNPTTSTMQKLDAASNNKPNPDDMELKDKFQDFAAGTFYKQLLKTLRESQHKAKYMHGGHAEEVFQQQFDQTITDSLAKSHGKGISEPLFTAYAQRH